MICFLQIIRIILISQPFAKGMVRNAIVKRTDKQDFFSTNDANHPDEPTLCKEDGPALHSLQMIIAKRDTQVQFIFTRDPDHL